MTVLVETRSLVKRFSLRDGRQVHAVRGVDLSIGSSEAVGLVGESGCGKTTLGRCILRLLEPTAGEVLFEGMSIMPLGRRALRSARRQMQMVFQNPLASLDPRMTVLQAVVEPLSIHRLLEPDVRREDQVATLLHQVGLLPDLLQRYPHELSAGQRQRVGIARALAVGPRFIVADEPVSALDVSVQAQVVNLLLELQQKHNLSYLFISHDLRVVHHLCQSIAVMYLGLLVEQAPASQLVADPLHPYTRALAASLDLAGNNEPIIVGEPPDPTNPPPGCAFHPRCPVYRERRSPRCREAQPDLREIGPQRTVACHEVDRVWP